MKRPKFTETQIVKAIQEEAAGRNADDICREMGISRLHFRIAKASMQNLSLIRN
jgi:putative transposase